MGGSVVWDFCFQGDLTDGEASDFSSLLGMLHKAYVSLRRGNFRLWKLDVKGKFSIKSFFAVLLNRSIRVEGWQSFWGSSLLSRVSVFCWVAKSHKFLTID